MNWRNRPGQKNGVWIQGHQCRQYQGIVEMVAARQCGVSKSGGKTAERELEFRERISEGLISQNGVIAGQTDYVCSVRDQQGLDT